MHKPLMCLSEIVLVITWESLPVKRKACLEKKNPETQTRLLPSGITHVVH